MDGSQFDALTRTLSGLATRSSRRTGLRMFTTAALLPVMERLPAFEAAAKGKKNKNKKKNKKKNQQKLACKSDADCRTPALNCETCVGGHCTDLRPLCGPCQKEVCDLASGTYSCFGACQAGESCCNGSCRPPCPEGQVRSESTCNCENPCTEAPFTKTCKVHDRDDYFCCAPCHQCCSGPGGGNRCCQPESCLATCRDGWCIGGTSSCTCPMP